MNDRNDATAMETYSCAGKIVIIGSSRLIFFCFPELCNNQTKIQMHGDMVKENGIEYF